ncbi:MAG: hypothetical protein KDB14_24440 [Planctomycetales bacterium]|nr:hypothetical protein [Planctomycetales bacterium]
MSIKRCPYCMDEVRIPAGVPETATVRCPLCLEEYQLLEVGLPPLLEVVDGGDAMLVGAGVVSGAAAAGEADTADGYRLAGSDLKVAKDTSDDGGALPAFSLTEEKAASGATSTVKTSRRPAKKKASPIKEMVKIVGGGVIGLAIGQLALWYLPGDWKTKQRDPFGLGPHVHKVAPWIVPSQVSGVSQVDLTNAGETQIADAGQTPVPAPAPADDMDLSKVGMNNPQAKQNAKQKQSKRKNGGAQSLDPGVAPEPTPPTPPTPDPGGLELPPLNPLTPEVPAPESSGGGGFNGIDGSSISIPPLDPAIMPSDQEADAGGKLAEAVQAAHAAHQRINKWAELSSDEKREVGTAYFEQLSAIADAIAAVGASHNQVRNRKDEIRELFATGAPQDNPRTRIIFSLGVAKLKQGEPGALALYGTIQSVGKEEGQPVIRLSIDKDTSVLVLCPEHDGTYTDGDQLFLLGTRLADDQHDFKDVVAVRADVLAVDKPKQ